VAFTATQADQTGDPSLASNSVSVTIPSSTSVALTSDPAAPSLHQPVTLTATTSGDVPDGTTVTFRDDSDSLGTGTTTGGVATLSVPNGFGVGDHPLTASVPATDTSLSSVSPVVDIVVSKSASTITLQLSKTTVHYGHAASGSIKVGGAHGGTATVSYDSKHMTIPVNSSGGGKFTLPARLDVGHHVVSAIYNGTKTVAPSGLAKATLTVTKASSSTALTVHSTTVRHGRNLKVTVAVGSHGDGAYPTGTITVAAEINGSGPKTQVTLHASDRGKATFFVAMPKHTGTAHVSAHYGGDSHFTKSTSKSRTVQST
jgi:hypothetical protein